MSNILCGSCAAYGSCKLEKKGTAIKCRNFWQHRSTSDFEEAIKKAENKRSKTYTGTGK